LKKLPEDSLADMFCWSPEFHPQKFQAVAETATTYLATEISIRKCLR
jgi:hypothetical protein